MSKTPVRIRLIQDVPRNGTENMAIDEYLMRHQLAAAHTATLRIYSWKNPCVTLGYFQNVAKVRARLGKDADNLQIIRRITGGGMVSHTKDLTFSLITPMASGLLPGDVKTSYLKINEALREGLRKKFPEVEYADCKTVPSGRPGKEGDRICFDAPSCYDLLLGKRKIVGASQRRKDGVILHQSTIFFPECSFEELSEYILDGFKSKWSVEFEKRELSGKEIDEARSIEFSRYSDAEWANPAISYAPS